MKCKLVMLAALALLLSFSLIQAADSVQVSIYDVARGRTLVPDVDTIYIDNTTPLTYRMEFGLENDAKLGGLSLGFITTLALGSDITLDYQSQGTPDGATIISPGHLTIVSGSRMHPANTVLDLGGFQYDESSNDYDGILPDTNFFGGAAFNGGVLAGPMQTMVQVWFNVVSGSEILTLDTLCIDSGFVPPAGEFLFIDEFAASVFPGFSGKICFPVGDISLSPADNETKPVAYAYDLGQNYPNPFNPETKIKFSLERKENVNLSVFNILGQHVRTLVDGEREAGPQEITWDGTDEAGKQVASGIYFYRLSSDKFVETRKMALMR